MNNDGFILIATVKYMYYESAVMCANSILDYYPEAKITLFTHPEWVDDEALDIFDQIITKDVPSSARAKLWALSKSPYDKTMYVDADAEVMSDDIRLAHDQLKPTQDIIMGLIRPYAAVVTKFPAGELTLHCGMFTYRRSELLYKIFDKWFVMWENQQVEWDLDSKLYPQNMLQPFDIFTFWRLMNLEGYRDSINIGIWEDDARWNFHGYHRDELNGKEIILYHHTLSKKGQNNEKNIPSKSYSNI
jgi:hypothetical protein